MNSANPLATLRSVPSLPKAPAFQPHGWQVPHLREETFSGGSVIYSPDNAASRLFVIRTGRVRLLRPGPGGRSVLSDLLPAGGVFGKLPWEPTLPDESSVASGTVSLWSADPAFLGAACRANESFAGALTESLGKSCQQQRRRIWSMTFKESPARLAEALLQLGEEFGEPCEHGGHFDLRRISQEDIADLIGSCRSFVSTLINEMKRWGWLGSAGRVLCLRDLEALKKAAFEDE